MAGGQGKEPFYLMLFARPDKSVRTGSQKKRQKLPVMIDIIRLGQVGFASNVDEAN
jgi:hypothetical protein